MPRTWLCSREELRTDHFYGWYNKGAIQEVVVLLAGSLGNQQASVTCTAKQWLMIVLRRRMESTDRVIRTQSTGL
jgi:hypothetical protein